jgi:hypothetical protein
MWSGLSWLKTRSNVGFMWTLWWTFGLYKRREFFLMCRRLSASLLEVTVSRAAVRARDQVHHPVMAEYCSNLSLTSLLPQTIKLSMITGTRFAAGGAGCSVFYTELTRECVFARSIRMRAPSPHTTYPFVRAPKHMSSSLRCSFIQRYGLLVNRSW